MESVDLCLGKRVRESLLLYWGVILGKIKLTVIWSYSRLRSDLLGKNKLNVIWSDSRLHRKFLEVELLSSRIPGFTTTY